MDLEGRSVHSWGKIMRRMTFPPGNRPLVRPAGGSVRALPRPCRVVGSRGRPAPQPGRRAGCVRHRGCEARHLRHCGPVPGDRRRSHELRAAARRLCPRVAGHRVTGSEGFGRSGDVLVDSLETPTGSYTVTEAFGRQDPGTALEYHQLNGLSRWRGRPGEHYDQYFEGKRAWPDMEPKAGLPCAIFLHAGMSESWGSISTDLATVIRFLKTAGPGDRFVMGVGHRIFLDPASTSGVAGNRALNQH